jgi:hypothetical protein
MLSGIELGVSYIHSTRTRIANFGNYLLPAAPLATPRNRSRRLALGAAAAAAGELRTIELPSMSELLASKPKLLRPLPKLGPRSSTRPTVRAGA